MTEPEILKIYPTFQLKPYDGMPVTAKVWASAHDEHRQSRRAHDLVFHGSGIVTGLEVIANDPPNQFVYISPGMAVDPAGNVIVLSEPVAYDFGRSSEGTLFLVIGAGERETKGEEDEIVKIQNEFVIAARPSMPKRPVVELARITLQKTGKPIKNPKIIAHPKTDELDLRYRIQLVNHSRKIIKIALCSVGIVEKSVIAGWDHLLKTAQNVLPYQFVLDIVDNINDQLEAYDLVYLSGKGVFKLEPVETKNLANYMRNGKTLFIEALDGSAEKSFLPLLEEIKITPSPIPSQAQILEDPFLFISAPIGATGNTIQTGSGLIFSTAGYSLAWSGKFAEGVPTRASIRDAHEWGINLLCHCLK